MFLHASASSPQQAGIGEEKVTGVDSAGRQLVSINMGTKKPEPVPGKVAVTTLQGWNDLRAVVPLVELVGRDADGGVKHLAASALEQLTGEKLGKDATAWWQWIPEQKRAADVQRALPASTPAEKTAPSPAPRGR